MNKIKAVMKEYQYMYLRKKLKYQKETGEPEYCNEIL